MRKRFVGTSLVAALVLLVASSALIAQRRPGRPAPPPHRPLPRAQ